ncbi:threonine/serine exporter family protein [Romboutsia lituseburensis]|uniref:threonine/serine exporter family protein n=1 Tax=Romboutsia lituseburensis TaxID=1537 RepID=UPI00215A18B9|nr:threonine/serine exporter family protein [Romboutsia lituseburensis]MCR8744933.1 threonine/serine exporter family protein [Romboutsia lituseburensis]
MILEAIASALSAISFGIIFNIKGRRLLAAGFGGGLSWFAYKLCLANEVSQVSSFFIAAICFSIYCEICARVYKTPATTLSVCCLIPLVPGYGVYNTMYEFIKGDYIKAIDYGINTLSLAGALALGVIFVSTLFRNFNLHKTLDNLLKSPKRIKNTKQTLEESFE